MAAYRFRAVRRDGSTEDGELRATDRADAMTSLAARDLFPIQVVELQRRSVTWGTRIPAGDLAVGLRILGTLLDAGLPLGRAAGVFATLAPVSWDRVVRALPGTLRDGGSLSAALAQPNASVPSVILGILRAGEAGGDVAMALRTAAELAETSAATRSAIRNALAYPAVLALAGITSVLILVTVVLPRFATMLADLGQTLPPATRAVLDAAMLVRRTAAPGVIGIGAAIAVFQAWLRHPDARLRWHAVLLQLPGIGGLRLGAASARACTALAALLETGVPMPMALAHAAAAAGDEAVAARIRSAREAVIAGRAVGASLEESKALPVSTVRLVRAGEESGRLPHMLAHAARLERQRTTDRLRRLVGLLEPALILLFAGIIAFVAAALLQAVYAVRPT